MSFATHAHRRSDHDRSGSDAVAELSRRHPSVIKFARAGWVAKGLVHVALGGLAASLAFRGGSGTGSGEEVSHSGALQQLRDTPLGSLALWLVAAGLALYVLWRIAETFLPAESSVKAWLVRAGYLVSALVYAAVAWTAVSIATRGGSGSGGSGGQESRIDRLTRDLMDMTGGRWLVGVVGMAIVAVGVVFAVRGATAGFREDLEVGGVGPVSGGTIVKLGRIGWIGRGLMMGIVGWFFVQAAVTYSPDDAQGLDGALREATASPAGAGLVAAVALGLVVYGIYCVVSAPITKLHPAD